MMQCLQKFTSAPNHSGSSQTYHILIGVKCPIGDHVGEPLDEFREGMKLFEKPKSAINAFRSSGNFPGHTRFSILYARQVNMLKKPRRSQIDVTASNTCTLANDNTNARYTSKFQVHWPFDFF